jgi:uncharacterized protein (DUF952 family)
MTLDDDYLPNGVHHLVRAIDWSDVTGTKYSPPSLSEDGFIHFSTGEQVPQTVERYYSNVDDLLVVTVDVNKLTAELRWEDLTGHGEFPHLYGPLDIDAVTDVRRYSAEPVNRVLPG